MEAIKKQAARLREQVAKQQQAVLKHLGHFGDDSVIVDEAEFQCYQQLQKLYNSTRTAKHLQKNIVRGVEGYVSTSLKQMEIARKLGDDCCKYTADNQGTNSHLSKVAIQFGTSRSLMEKERESLLGILRDQVSEPLRALITSAPLEDARHLTHRYDRLRQEVEAQAADVLRRRSKTKDSDITAENCMKLRTAEARLTELKSTLVALGREATAAMSSVEDQQQQITVQRLFTMVDAERSYHQHILAVLDKLHSEMILEEQQNESSPLRSLTLQRDVNAQHSETSSETDSQIRDNQKEAFFNAKMILEEQQNESSPLRSLTLQRDVNAQHSETSNETDSQIWDNQTEAFFIAKVIHPFDAQAEGELSLSVDDYIVVRQVAPTGWSEGESKGKAGWFPSAYVEKQEKAPAGKIMEESSSP